MLAYQLTAWQQPAELREVPKPTPGAGEVLVKVAGSGACHSDLHLMEWPEGALPFDPPFTLGHENAGWVEQVGPGVEGLEVGEAVAVYGPWGCGRCRACRLSRENYCERGAEGGAFGGGLGLDGGMAEYMLVPSPRLLIPLGDLDPREAAPLSDAALTPYHAIKRALPKLVPGSAAVVIGVGGLGQMAVQLLKVLSSTTVIAVDHAADKRASATQAGAEHTLASDDAAAEKIRELTGGRGVDLVLDVVGADQTLALGQSVIAPEGSLTLLGLAGGTISYGWTALPFAVELTTTYWGTATELIEVLELARHDKIRASVARFPLERAAEAYEQLREGRVPGRAVICPHG